MKRLTGLACASLAVLSLLGCEPSGMNRASDESEPTAPPQSQTADNGATAADNEGVQRLHNLRIRLSRDATSRASGTSDSFRARLDPVTASRAKVHTRSEVTADNQLVAVGLNEAGEEVYRHVTRDPLELEAEVFNPNTGAVELNREVEKDTGLLRLNIPARLHVERLVLYRVDTGESGFELNRFKEVAVKVAPESEQARLRSRSMTDNNVFPVQHNGDSENRVDLVIVSEGYTENDLPAFEQDVDTIVNGYFGADVYNDYESLFNVWRVEVPSNESGAGQGNPKDTRFDAHFGCFNIQRLLCVDENEVLDYLATVLPANAIDKVLVVVNTDTYGGAGGQVATMSLAPQAIDLALHELGHSFANLADEYDYGTCRRGEPNEANVTADPQGGKWSQWFDRAENIGVYEGARYCASDMYRPTFTSMMNDLGQPFYAVNESQIVRSMYEYVSVLDSASPSAETVTLESDQKQTFTATAVTNHTDTTRIQWYLDGQAVHQGSQYTFVGAEHSGGTHTLNVQVSDETDRVINDPDDLLSSDRSWTIALNDSGGSCEQAPATPGSLASSEPSNGQFDLSWNESIGARTYTVQKWSGSDWYNLRDTDGTSLTLDAGGAGQTEYFRVFAQNDCGDSSASAWISVEYPVCTAEPDQPTGLQAQDVQSNQYTLTWWPVDNADSYRVEVWNGYDRSWDTLATTTDSWYYVNGLSAGTVQYVRVVAENTCGDSQATPYIRVETPR